MNDLILLIGTTGTGKSTHANKLIKDINKLCLVYDVQNEYKRENLTYPILIEVKQFIGICSNLINSTVLFEEATAFFSGSISKDMMHLIVSKRHKNLDIILIFHSINSVPPRLYELASKIVLLKTNDEPKKIKAKASFLYPHFMKLRSHPNKHVYKIIDIYENNHKNHELF